LRNAFEISSSIVHSVADTLFANACRQTVEGLINYTGIIQATERMKGSYGYFINAGCKIPISADTSMAHMLMARSFPWIHQSQSPIRFQESENLIWILIKQVLFLPAVVFWLFGMMKYFRRLIVAINGLLTLELFVSTVLLATNLSAENSSHLSKFDKDTSLVMAINPLIFFMWYRIIDCPNLARWSSRESEPWDFLFPQRASSNPQFTDWASEYIDYLFPGF
jgi:hypothetical protein